LCALCGEPVADDAMQCESCGMTLEGVGNRPDPFPRRVLWMWAGALVVVYLVVLLVVAVVPD
jgi:predicted nucleic acid-binding Zn ribbon protein